MSRSEALYHPVMADGETLLPEDREHQAVQNYLDLVDGDDAVASAIKALLTDAVACEATSIEVSTEVFEDTEIAQARLRVLGVWTAHDRWPLEVGEGVIARFQQVGTGSSRTAGVPLEQCDVTVPNAGGEGRRFRMRFDLMRTVSGLTLTIKLIRRGWRCPDDLNLESLFPPEASGTAELLRSALSGGGGGLVVIAGPSGSGKSTTLAAVMREIAKPERKVVSVEDTVEVDVPGVEQVESTPESPFVDGLRALLRSRADAIVVGQVDDQETAEALKNAFRSARVVVAVVEARDAAIALSRLLSMGAERAELAENLRLVVAQRLVRRLCSACSSGGEPEGCPRCSAGYDGGVAVVETLHLDEWADDQARAMIAQGEPPRKLRTLDQYRRFANHAQWLVRHKVTTAAEVARVLGEGWDHKS